jgi:hypothetical protein
MEGELVVDLREGERLSFGPGEVYREALSQVMQARNPSATTDAEAYVFQVDRGLTLRRGPRGLPTVQPAQKQQRFVQTPNPVPPQNESQLESTKHRVVSHPADSRTGATTKTGGWHWFASATWSVSPGAVGASAAAAAVGSWTEAAESAAPAAGTTRRVADRVSATRTGLWSIGFLLGSSGFVSYRVHPFIKGVFGEHGMGTRRSRGTEVPPQL